MKGYRLPKGLMLGAATCAAQIEGGDTGHNWNDWEKKGRLHENFDTSITEACDHWNRWKEDIDIACALGLETYRFGIEWARLEPEKGKFDRAAADRYREEIQYMKERGIVPLMTLHHFTNPVWFEELGAFSDPRNAKYFLKFVGFAVNMFGDLVSDYVTINEPNVYTFMGYGGQGFPPGEMNPLKIRRVLSVLACCHIRAYQKIHRMREAMGYSDTKVGFALHMRAFAPKDPSSAYDRKNTGLERYLFQEMAARAFLTGDFRKPMVNYAKLEKGVYADYLGINYYTRSHVHNLLDDLTRPQDAKSDYGWEIYPNGLEECMTELRKILEKPVWILENGICDNEDAFRSLFIYEHLGVIARTEIPVERYYHWSLIDNFEWLDGVEKRFGLVGIDFKSQTRTVKKSGHFYREIIRFGGVTEELAERYAGSETYHL